MFFMQKKRYKSQVTNQNIHNNRLYKIMTRKQNTIQFCQGIGPYKEKD